MVSIGQHGSWLWSQCPLTRTLTRSYITCWVWWQRTTHEWDMEEIKPSMLIICSTTLCLFYVIKVLFGWCGSLYIFLLRGDISRAPLAMQIRNDSFASWIVWLKARIWATCDAIGPMTLSQIYKLSTNIIAMEKQHTSFVRYLTMHNKEQPIKNGM